MPRRNRRDVFEPLDLTFKQDIPRPPAQPLSPEVVRANRARREREAAERQRAARVNHGIDWTVCLVPGCGDELYVYGSPIHHDERERDHTVALPLCMKHVSVVVQQAAWRANDPLMIKTNTMVAERKEARRLEHEAADRKAWLEQTEGHIYFVRLNGLVKVGWSRDVDQRLRAYGPDVEVLCIYPGSRDDETYLHRQLRPVLARGREWYEDCKIIADFVTAAIEKHGPPERYDQWSRPKQVIKQRTRGAAVVR